MLADTVPLYPLYAMLFADTGLSSTEISALFVLWSTVSIVAEVPCGALADRFSRRGALVAAGVLQAGGYVLWVVLPGFPGFAAGFALWCLGGASVSGTIEALLYDGLATAGAESDFIVDGELSLHGVTRPVPLHVELNGISSDGRGHTLAGFSATAELNRCDFGIDTMLPLDGGGVVVGETIRIALEIEAGLQG
jgi:hypothetical protein